MTRDFQPCVSVIIPTLNAEKELPRLLDGLMRQSYPIDEIIVVDSASEDKTEQICSKYEKVKFLPIKREEFNHGRTRDYALSESKGDVVVFLTQDAIPADAEMLKKLIAPLDDCNVAVSTGRQLPKATATRMERLVRAFNYPSESRICTTRDVEELGIKTFFCSDVCAAYNRKVYLKLGGFPYPVKTNEDMFFAAKAICSGYGVAYAADAMVYHSHNFTLQEQYHRNWLQGYEMEQHKDLLGEVKKEKEGLRLAVYVSRKLLEEGHIIDMARFAMDCAARLLGNRMGKKKATRLN